MSWVLYLFKEKDKTEILSVLHIETMTDISYILNESQSKCSNFYHRLVIPRGIFEKISIEKV